MTTIISRLYPDARTAAAVAEALHAAGFPGDSVAQVPAGPDMAAALAAAGVPEASAAAYAAAAVAGNAAVAVRAEVTPLGAALRAMEIVDAHPSIRVEGAEPNAYIRLSAQPLRYLSILSDHPRFMTSDIRPGSGLGPGRVSDAFGLPLLSKHRARRSAIPGGRFMSRMFWPMPLLARAKERHSAISGGRYMSRWFWPMPLLSKRSGG